MSFVFHSFKYRLNFLFEFFLCLSLLYTSWGRYVWILSLFVEELVGEDTMVIKWRCYDVKRVRVDMCLGLSLLMEMINIIRTKCGFREGWMWFLQGRGKMKRHDKLSSNSWLRVKHFTTVRKYNRGKTIFIYFSLSKMPLLTI